MASWKQLVRPYTTTTTTTTTSRRKTVVLSKYDASAAKTEEENLVIVTLRLKKITQGLSDIKRGIWVMPLTRAQQHWKSTCLRIAILFVLTLFPPINATIFQSFVFDERLGDGKAYLKADYRIQYGQPEQILFHSYAILFGLVFGLLPCIVSQQGRYTVSPTHPVRCTCLLCSPCLVCLYKNTTVLSSLVLVLV